MKIADVLKKEYIIPDLTSISKKEVLKELSDTISSKILDVNANKLYEILLKRENLCSTALDSGIAIPHGKLPGIKKIIAGFGRSKSGIDYESLDGKKSTLFVLLVAPENVTNEYINLLARFSKILKKEEVRKNLMNAKSGDEIYNLIIKEDEKI
ncbi:MAG: PTS transporter subunit EIIA [Candidatus Dadabacteria bacterium]|nr:PTS transporter subunit EIIA [Candidatus Dadabacteria bacterium]NIQ15594.1 PTS transporter subunit EIIA [Candidatus Dadabacteria bacterium]